STAPTATSVLLCAVPPTTRTATSLIQAPSPDRRTIPRARRRGRCFPPGTPVADAPTAPPRSGGLWPVIGPHVRRCIVARVVGGTVKPARNHRRHRLEFGVTQ